MSLAASVSRGADVPWSRTKAHGKVLILSAEDDPARVLKPRVVANGADTELIFYQAELFSLDPRGLARLEEAIGRIRPSLVIIDPIIAYLRSEDDLNNAADMMRFLTELDGLAKREDCAIVLVRHLRKTKEGSAINHGLGSIALAGRVRSVLAVGRNPADKEMKAIVNSKNNYAKEGPAILFSLQTDKGPVPRVKWEGTDSTLTAEQIFQGDGAGRPRRESDEAMEFLKQLLADGPMDSKAVISAARGHDISGMTLRRAARELNVTMARTGRGSRWSL
jgi:hypothetical protein